MFRKCILRASRTVWNHRRGCENLSSLRNITDPDVFLVFVGTQQTYTPFGNKILSNKRQPMFFFPFPIRIDRSKV